MSSSWLFLDVDIKRVIAHCAPMEESKSLHAHRGANIVITWAYLSPRMFNTAVLRNHGNPWRPPEELRLAVIAVLPIFSTEIYIVCKSISKKGVAVKPSLVAYVSVPRWFEIFKTLSWWVGQIAGFTLEGFFLILLKYLNIKRYFNPFHNCVKDFWKFAIIC